MKKVYILIGFFIISSCKQETKNITNLSDYAAYFDTEKKTDENLNKKELDFWNSKIKEDSLQLLALGHAAESYTNLFKESANINHIIQAEKCLKKAVSIAAIGKKGYELALAQTYITQHRFKDAKELLNPYEKEITNKSVQWVLFDVNMELGFYKEAEKNLANFQNYNDYNYLIRLAKFSDYSGDLDATIKYMEKAMVRAERSGKKSLMIWTYTNLGDYYGHAGRINDSYAYYLKALALDNNNAYAKKGIAWILFSYENKPTEALALLNDICKKHQSPDYNLLKAEIAVYQNNMLLKEKHLAMYFNETENPSYGAMHNTYKISLYAEEKGETSKAIELALKEVENRATPETYALLAYSYLLNGDKEKALKIIKMKVENKTFEPQLQYYMAEVFKENGIQDKVLLLKEELKGALYELGPGYESKIARL